MSILGVTSMRNEAPYIVEWVAHHLAAGFDHLLILTHGNDDGSEALLDALEKTGRVTHLPFVTKTGGDKTVQWQAMKLADGHPRVKSADWVLFFDCDEFLCLADGVRHMDDLLSEMPEAADAVALKWRLFGNGGEARWKKGLTPERFTRTAAEGIELPAAHFFKTLYRPRAFQKMGVHRPKRRKDEVPRWNLGGAQPMPPQFAQNDGRINLYGLPFQEARGWLNHYSVRSAQEFMVKRQRGLPNKTEKRIDLGYWAERNFNTVEDRAIEPMMATTRNMVSDLMALDGVLEAHEAGCAWHREAFETLMQNEAEERMFWQLGLLAGSTAPAPEETAAHLTRLARLKAQGAA